MEELGIAVRVQILDVLPDDEEAAGNAVHHLVGEMKMESISDLKFVKEEDILPYFGAFKARRLLEAWKEKSREEPRARPEPHGAETQPLQLQRLTHRWDFKLDWEDIYNAEDNVKSRLRAGKKLKKRQKREIVKRVATQVRNKVPHAKRAIFRQIMTDIKKKYSLTFKSKVAQGKLGTKSLCKKLQDKFDNDKRPKRRTRCDQEAPDIKPAFGCRKWRLAAVPHGETEESLELAQQALSSYFEQTRPSSWDWEYIEEAMKKTYGNQRSDINKQAEQLLEMGKKLRKRQRRNKENQDPEEDADDIVLLITEQLRDKWPFLFQPSGMINHFNMLTQKDLREAFVIFMMGDAVGITQFLTETNKPSGKPKRIKKQIRRAKKYLPAQNAELMGLLMLLLERFEEDSESLWIVIDPCASEEDITQCCKIPKTPRLIVAGDDIFHPSKIYLTMDEQVMGTAIDLREGMLLLFASYYVFNLNYDAHAQVTLEFMQRCIVDIDPPKENKRPQRSDGGHSSTHRVHHYLDRFNTKYDEYLGDREKDTEDEDDI